MTPKRVVLYARTNTAEKQDPELQLRELREFSRLRGWNIVRVFEDRGFSGTNSNRPELKLLIEGARARKFDVVAVWKLDRFARSLKDLVNMLQELGDVGVEFVSLRDHIDMTTSTGRLMVHLLGAFGEFEGNLIRERVRAGLANARAKGKVLGRPCRREDAKILALRMDGHSVRRIARILGISASSVQRAMVAKP